MSPDDVPVLHVLRQALSYHSDRARVLTENVANANTPGYTPRDIPQSAFEQMLGSSGPSRVEAVSVSATNPLHIAPASGDSSRSYRSQAMPDSETTINGNSVVLEEQMVRANENRMRFETALGLYQKNLSLLRLAVKAPGQ